MKTFRDVLRVLQGLTLEQLSCNLTWHDRETNEFYPMENITIEFNTSSEALDLGHPFFEINP